MLSGDNGILQKATDAKTQTGIGQEKEIVALAYNSAVAKKIGNGDSTPVTANDLNTALTNQGATANGSNPIKVTFTDSKRQYNIDGNGSITLNIENIKITEFSINPTGTQKAIPTIPDGFYYVGGTVNSGYVISDDVSDENKYTSSNNVGNDLTGNQFVWIPVAQNQKITLKVDSEENITNITLYDPLGDEINLGTISGTTYENTSISPTINGGYKVKIETANNTIYRTLVVRTLYAMDTFQNISYEELLSKYSNDEFFESEEWFNEVCGYYGNPSDRETLYQRMGVSSDEEYITVSKQRHNPYNNIYYTVQGLKDTVETEDYTTSVNANGGFWIGRYEATYEDGDAASKPATSIRYNSSTALTNGMLWNYISQTNALTKAKAYNTKCSLPTGAAWDRTIGWLVQTNNKTLAQVATNSKDWGNCGEDSFSNTNNIAKTGEFEQTKANNIYDLAGNLGECTTEVPRTNRINQRGGTASSGGYCVATSRRGDISPSSDALDGTNYKGSGYVYGFRLVLYLDV